MRKALSSAQQAFTMPAAHAERKSIGATPFKATHQQTHRKRKASR
jgi:hypothetical protein